MLSLVTAWLNTVEAKQQIEAVRNELSRGNSPQALNQIHTGNILTNRPCTDSGRLAGIGLVVNEVYF